MSYLSQMLETRSLERPATPITQETLAALLGGTASATGRLVNPANALQVATVFACVNVIAETISMLPLHLYRKSDEGRYLAENHPLYSVLLDEPNPEMTSVDFWNALVGHVLLWGNGYAEIVRNGAGQIKQLWPLRPDLVQMYRNARGDLMYMVTLSPNTTKETTEFLRAKQILHIRGLSFEGLDGYKRVVLGKEAIGLAMATEQFGAEFYANEARPGGVLLHPGQLSEDAQKRLAASWNEAHRGLGNAHRVAILEEGIQWKETGIAPENAQYLETRKYQRSEIASLFRMPPHKIGDLDKATFSNIEEQDIDFEKNTISPWAVRIEKAIKQRCLSDDEKNIYFAKFSMQGLLRGDLKSRYESYHTARQDGWLNGNEIRAFEDLNPYDGGDEYLINGNMVPVGQAAKANEQPPQPAPAQADEGDEKS